MHDLTDVHGNPLNYNGRTLDPNPINTTLEAAARELIDHGRVFVELQPGDATRYGIVIVTGITAVGAGPDRWWVFTTNLSNTGAACVWPGHVGPYDLEVFSNDWSRVFLASWLNVFAAAVMAADVGAA